MKAIARRMVKMSKTCLECGNAVQSPKDLLYVKSPCAPIYCIWWKDGVYENDCCEDWKAIEGDEEE